MTIVAASQLLAARRQLLGVGDQLRAIRHALIEQDEESVSAHLALAERRLARASVSASALSVRMFRAIPLLGSPARALSAGIRAGREGIAAMRTLSEASSSFPTSAAVGSGRLDLSLLNSAASSTRFAVTRAEVHLAHAQALLEGPAGAMLKPVSRPARAMRVELDARRDELQALGRAMVLLEDLTGEDVDVRLLLVAQDSFELRPTGGYIGSYGVVRIAERTARLETYGATEDLPRPVPAAPAPDGLGLYLPGDWRLSNVNWWPDFPTSAAAAREMFRRQGGGTVDGVIALTEQAIARLIGAVGPLKLPSYATPVVEEGFGDRAVFEVELKSPRDEPRKKFLVELSHALFGRLVDLPTENIPAVTDAFRESVGGGDVQLWFEDVRRQSLLAGFAVAGSLPSTDGDFLMVVDANMAAGKSNRDVVKSIDYRVDRTRSGRTVGHLRVQIHNKGERSRINPLYNSYLRVYAPAGARLINAVDGQASNVARDGNFQVFTQLLIVQPKGHGIATFDYELPPSIRAGGAYELTLVRQAGTPSDRLRVAVEGRTAESDPASRVLRFRG